VGRTDVLARGPLELSVPDARVGAARTLALVAVVALVSGLATWLISPRFEIETPSVVDDWTGIAHSPEQLRDVLLLQNPEAERFRPGWIAWTTLQWHTFDAPDGMVGPNVWGVLRVVILVAGLTLLTSLLLPRPRSRWDAVLHAAVAGIPAFLVVTAPKFVVDLTRFGPQEPLLVGGMALGGSLLVLAARPLLDPARSVPWLRTVLLVVAGLGFWALGTYQKETALAVLPLLAVVLGAGRSRLARWGELSVLRRSAAAAVGGLALLPLLHVAIESARIVRRGDIIYGAEVDSGKGILRGTEALVDWAHEALPLAGRWVLVAALVLTLLVTVLRRKLDLLALGALASGSLALALAGQSGVVATRYYIPTYALFAIALALALVRLPAPFQAAGLVAVFLAFLPAAPIHDEVRYWVDNELSEGALIRAMSEAVDAGCVVAADGLDLERSFALPVLVAVEQRGGEAPNACEGGTTYMLFGNAVLARELARSCEPGALERVRPGDQFMTLHRCARLRERPVLDPLVGLVEPEVLVTLRRLRPSLDG
jgi:hypothetical protein